MQSQKNVIPLPPSLSVVILTLNEATMVGPCLLALTAQTVSDFEVLVIDADSQDGTLEAAAEAGAALGDRLRLHACGFRMPIGQARNLGARLARARSVAFVSADVELAPTWVERARDGLRKADMVFGQQFHAPLHATIPSAVRGLRYQFPREAIQDGARFASNVAGACKTEILRRFPFDDEADAAEDLVVARQARRAGYTIHYDPDLHAVHHDITSHREELHKNIREGRGWAAYRNELVLHRGWLAWGVLLSTGALALLDKRTRAAGIAGALAVLWAPALRRAMRHTSQMGPGAVVKGVVAAPLYDLAFLANYLWGLGRPPRRRGR